MGRRNGMKASRSTCSRGRVPARFYFFLTVNVAAPDVGPVKNALPALGLTVTVHVPASRFGASAETAPLAPTAAPDTVSVVDPDVRMKSTVAFARLPSDPSA